MANGITTSIILMLVIMLSMNIGLSFTQEAVNELNSTNPVTVITTSSSPLSNYYTGSLANGTSTVNADYIPQDDAYETGDTGNLFTDTYVALKSWVNTGLGALGFLANIFVQPAGFLSKVGVAPAICLSIQILWSMIFLLLITAWIMGRT